MNLAIAWAGLPGLELHALLAELPRPLGELPTVDVAGEVAAFLAGSGIDPTLRATVRDVLRQHGYRPTGRGKPSAEYLASAAVEGRFPAINAAVDAGNLVSLHSGLPISMVDADLAQPSWSVRPGADGESYAFNASAQAMDLAGLPCLCDRDGPCANAVKDAERTKTTTATRRVLAVVWGVGGADGALARTTAAALQQRLQATGANARIVPFVPLPD